MAPLWVDSRLHALERPLQPLEDWPEAAPTPAATLAHLGAPEHEGQMPGPCQKTVDPEANGTVPPGEGHTINVECQGEDRHTRRCLGDCWMGLVAWGELHLGLRSRQEVCHVASAVDLLLQGLQRGDARDLRSAPLSIEPPVGRHRQLVPVDPILRLGVHDLVKVSAVVPGPRGI
eukprot:10309315-Alexandrium_andersonii.AAC.1